MRRFVLPLACVLACAGLLPTLSRGATTSPAGTPPPEIYHVVTSAACARLHERVRPAVAMILQNDQTIAKSPPLFKRYARGTLASDVANANGAPAAGDSMYNQTPETSMALQQMSYLVTPIARNIIAAETLLTDGKLLEPTGNATDDATLAQVKQQLMETIAYQSASLDLINGFVQTMQLGEIQHAGEEYLAAIQGTDSSTKPIQQEPNQWQDPNTPGLPPNPYALDVTQIPGLAVGYNPLSHIMDGLQWLRVETQKREDVAGKTISAVRTQCGK
ncbi:MAG: hypothetical protein JO113_01215 [Candidatus Eremiobacteraeota bacterium]|nr:hypothetical protein [Candidatus Eremiobacteraeota bacterium]